MLGNVQVVIVTTLDCFLPYPTDSDCLQTGGTSWPSWKPLPSTDPAILGPHLTEFVATEFAHAGALRVTIVRLGHMLWDVRGELERRNLAGELVRFSTTTVEAVDAIIAALETEPDLDWNDEGQRGYELRRLQVIHCGTANPDVPAVPLEDWSDGPQTHPIRNVLITGGNGFLGPATVEAMKSDYGLCVSDIHPYGWRKNDQQEIGAVPLNALEEPNRSIIVDAADAEGVEAAVASTDVVINLAVMRGDGKIAKQGTRLDRQVAFDVSTKGTYNAIRAAVDHGHRRFVNTGPIFAHTGHTYSSFAHDISEESPIRPGETLRSDGKRSCSTCHRPS